MIIPYLIVCARESPLFGPTYAQQLLHTFVPLFLEVIKEEPEPEVLIVLFMAFKVRVEMLMM